jgi:hypothetical protein
MLKKYFHENWNDTHSEILMILAKVGTNSLSLLVIIITILYMINLKIKHKQNFNTYNEKIVLVLIFTIFIRSFSNIYYPNTFSLCTTTKFIHKLTEQIAILSFFLLCYLILKGIQKNSSFFYFSIISIFCYTSLFIGNVLLIKKSLFLHLSAKTKNFV